MDSVFTKVFFAGQNFLCVKHAAGELRHDKSLFMAFKNTKNFMKKFTEKFMKKMTEKFMKKLTGKFIKNDRIVYEKN
jgi:urate oxidase